MILHYFMFIILIKVHLCSEEDELTKMLTELDPGIDRNLLRDRIETFKHEILNSKTRRVIQEKSYDISSYCPNNKPDICQCTDNQFNCTSHQVEVTILRGKDVRIHCQSHEWLVYDQVTEMSLGLPDTLIIENCFLPQIQSMIVIVLLFKEVNIHPPVYFHKNGRNSIYDYIDVGEIAMHYLPYLKYIEGMTDHKLMKKHLVQLILEPTFIEQLISDIPKILPIGEMKLKVLKFQGSDLTHLDANAFDNLIIVDDLHFIKNEMKDLKPDIFKFAFMIKKIIFDGNNFSLLPKKLLWTTRRLTDFELHNSVCPINTIPGAFFSNLTSLKSVLITNNGLKSIPHDVFHGTSSIENISLAMNDLTDVSVEVFAQQINLHNLDLSKNKLTSFKHGNFPSSMKMLNLSWNYIVDINSGVFKRLSNLKELYLDNNQIDNLQSNIFEDLTSIEVIDLSNNHLGSMSNPIQGFPALHNLQTLDLGFNKIKVIGNLTQMKSLRKLDLSNNNISQVSDIIWKQINSSQMMINLNNNQIKNINQKQLVEMLDHESKTSFSFSNNPLNCDCKLYDFVMFIIKPNQSTLVFLNISNDDLQCYGNDKSQGTMLTRIDTLNLICEVKSDCPNKCKCFERPADKVMVVNCSSQRLSSIPNLPMLVLPSENGFISDNIELDIAHNKINQLPSKTHPGYSKVIRIFGQNNSISHLTIDEFPDHLITLDLRNNKLKTIDKGVIEELKSIKHLSLMGNNWKCTCSLVDLMTYVKSDHKNTIDYNNWICDDKRPFKTFNGPSDICFNPIYLIVVFTIITTVFGILAALYYRFRKQIKIWLYSHGLCMCLVSYEEEGNDKEYDAFIVFSEDDNEYVGRTLIPGLEEQSPRFKCCIPTRDCDAGEMPVTQSLDCIRNSRRTIIVMSANFLKSQWAQWEFRTSQLSAFKEIENNSRVIVIILGDVEDLEGLHDEFRSYIEINTYVQSNDPWFWKKLRYAMPHRSMQQINAESEDISNENYVSNNDDISLI